MARDASREPLVTVIVPVYNVAQYLRRCVASITSQLYARLEILLVDDGSTDGSGALCDQLAATDARITVLHKPNGGLSSARNAALDVAQGQWITMVDSDDYVDSRLISTLLELAMRTSSDIAIGGWVETSSSKAEKPPARPCNAQVSTFTAQEAMMLMYYQRTLTCSAWGRIYKASIFQGLRYKEGIVYEDLALSCQILRRATKVALTSQPLYYYMQRPASILGSYSPRRLDVLNVVDALEQEVAVAIPSLLPAMRSRKLSACFNVLRLAPSQPQYQQGIQRAWNGIKQLRWGCLLDKRVRLQNKIGILLSCLGRRITRALLHAL